MFPHWALTAAKQQDGSTESVKIKQQATVSAKAFPHILSGIARHALPCMGVTLYLACCASRSRQAIVSLNFPVCVILPMHVPKCASLSLDTCTTMGLSAVGKTWSELTGTIGVRFPQLREMPHTGKCHYVCGSPHQAFPYIVNPVLVQPQNIVLITPLNQMPYVLPDVLVQLLEDGLRLLHTIKYFCYSPFSRRSSQECSNLCELSHLLGKRPHPPPLVTLVSPFSLGRASSEAATSDAAVSKAGSSWTLTYERYDP